MTDEILKKLEKMEEKVDKIEAAVGLIAVQTERINNVSNQVSALWAKYDDAFSPGGIINQVKHFQAGCPRESIKEALKRQWVIIALVATMVVGIGLKAFWGG